LVDARHVRVVEFLVTGNVRLGRDDVLGPVMPAAIRTDESITVAKKVAGTLRVPFSAHGVCGLLWKTRHLLIRRS
jgi:hypothetical protein